MSTIQQLKAARALINWTQSDLAKSAGLHVNAVNNVERGLSTPRAATLEKMQRALEQGGVTFIAGRGVELRDHAIEIHKSSGKTLLQPVIDDILATLTSPHDEILGLIADLPAFLAFDTPQIARFTAEQALGQWPVRIITATAADLPTAQIKILPQHQMGQVDIITYAASTVFINWPQQEAVILKNSDLAFTQKTFLETLWG